MTGLGALLTAGALCAAAPSLAQTVGSCTRGDGAGQRQAVWVLFDLGSVTVKEADKPRIIEAAIKARAHEVASVCLVGHTDRLGERTLNEKVARARSLAVAAELIRAGYPPNGIVIAADPEAFGNLDFGRSDEQESDRRVTILFTR